MFLHLQHWRSYEADEQSNNQRMPFHRVKIWQQTVSGSGERIRRPRVDVCVCLCVRLPLTRLQIQ